jgi:hypothetical protein
MQYLQLQLTGPARAWLKSLPAESIHSWDDLVRAFTGNFQGTFERPTTIEELRGCHQKENESIRAFIRRWTILRNSAEDITEQNATEAFRLGLRHKNLREHLGREKPKTVGELMNIANKWADGEESMQYELVPVKLEPGTSTVKDQVDSQHREGRSSDRKRKRKEQSVNEDDGKEFVAAEFSAPRNNNNSRRQGGDWRRRPQDNNRQNRSPVQLDDPCTFHTFRNKDGEVASSHTLRNCRRFRELIQLTNAPAADAQAPPKDGRTSSTPTTEAYTPPRGSMMIHKGCTSKRGQKAASRQAYLATNEPPATPEYLNWSEGDVRFSRADHPPKVPRPGHSALVVSAQIGGYNVSRVFMDGGSGINIIFADTLRRMQVLLENLLYTDTTFHGIVPGKAVYPLGRIVLEVKFGTPDNFRRERLEFEVVDWKSQYHVVLGRPAYARFMAVPHYIYLKLKMPGPRGTITISGNFKHADDCDRDFDIISESFGMEEELTGLKEAIDSVEPPLSKKPAQEASFETGKDTRAHQIHPTDPSKTALVSTSLPAK